jgi:hypothetical protein
VGSHSTASRRSAALSQRLRSIALRSLKEVVVEEALALLGRRGIAPIDDVLDAQPALARGKGSVFFNGSCFPCRVIILDGIAEPARVTASHRHAQHVRTASRRSVGAQGFYLGSVSAQESGRRGSHHGHISFKAACPTQPFKHCHRGDMGPRADAWPPQIRLLHGIIRRSDRALAPWLSGLSQYLA